MASPPTSPLRQLAAVRLVVVFRRWGVWAIIGWLLLSSLVLWSGGLSSAASAATAGAAAASGAAASSTGAGSTDVSGSDDAGPRSVLSISLSSGAPSPAGEATKSFLPASQTSPSPVSGLEGDAGEIVDRVESAVSQVEDLQMQVRMELINPESGSITKARGYLRALLPELIRLDFLEPDMLQGMTLLVDVAANQALQFHPVTEQVIIQPWDRLAQERGLQLEFERWLGLPDPEQYEFRRLADQEHGDVIYVTLEGIPREPGAGLRYEFLIHPTRWWVEHIRLYDAENRLIFMAWLDEIVMNQGISEADLRALPPDAEIIRL